MLQLIYEKKYEWSISLSTVKEFVFGMDYVGVS